MTKMGIAGLVALSIFMCMWEPYPIYTEEPGSLIGRYDSVVVKHSEVLTLRARWLYVKDSIIVREGGTLLISDSQCVVGDEIKVEEGGSLTIRESFIDMGCQLRFAGDVRLERVMWFQTHDKNPPSVLLEGCANLIIESSDLCGASSVPAISGTCNSVSITDCQLSAGALVSFIDLSAKRFSMSDNRLLVSQPGPERTRDRNVELVVVSVVAEEIAISGNSCVAYALCKSVYSCMAVLSVKMDGNRFRVITSEEDGVDSVIVCRARKVDMLNNVILGAGYRTFIRVDESHEVRVRANQAIGGYKVWAMFSISSIVCVVSCNKVVSSDMCSNIMVLDASYLAVTGNIVKNCDVSSVYWVVSGIDIFEANSILDCRGARLPRMIENPYVHKKPQGRRKDSHAWDLLIVQGQARGRHCSFDANAIERCKAVRMCLLMGEWSVGEVISSVAGWTVLNNTFDVLLEVESEWNSESASRVLDLLRNANRVARLVGVSRVAKPEMWE